MTSVTIETDPWLEKARALAPIIEKHRDEGEQERGLPQETYEAMRDAGLYALSLPRVYGGEQAPLETPLLVIEEVARHDGAAGWNLMIGMQGGLFADYLPESGAMSVFGRERTIKAGNFGPTGQAIPVPGGFRLSGRWSFASGCRHAAWFVCGALVMEEGGPRRYPDGAPQIYLMFVPASEVTIIDGWQTGGLRGTGSHDFEAKDVFVPEDHCFLFALLAMGPERQNAGYTQPFMALAAPQMAAVALGIARDAVESFKALAAEKTPTASSSKLEAQATVREKIGLAQAMLGAARSYLLETNAMLAQTAHPDSDLQTQIRLASAYAARSAEEAVQLIYSMGGGTVIYNRSRLDRCFRDVHTVSHHILLSPSNFEMAGQYLLTGELPMRR